MIGDIKNIDIAGFNLFKRDDKNILNSEIVGVPIWGIALIGVGLWIVKKIKES